MNLNQIMLTLIFLIQSLQSKCIKALQKEQTIQQNQPLWMNYQIQTDKVVLIDNQIILNLIQENETQIYLTYKDYQLQFSNQALNYSQDLKGKPGEYMQIVLPIYSQAKIQTRNFQSQIKFVFCLDSDYQNTEYNIKVQQSNIIYQQQQDNIDTNNLGIKLWLKLIIQDDQKRFIKLSSQSNCVFEYIFQNKQIQLSQNAIKLQQQLFFNVWFYFEINLKQIQVNLFDTSITIKSFYKENYKQTVQIRYSFDNQLTFRHQSAIFENFIIIQNQQSILQNLCQPDCQLCDNFICIQCKKGNILYNGICYCQQELQTTNQNGTCIFPAQFLQLTEINQSLNEKQCFFGYKFSQDHNECLPCFNHLNLPEISCLLEIDPIQLLNQELLVHSFKKLIKTEIIKCPRNCFTCQVKQKVLTCNTCINGRLNQFKICEQCKDKNCDICSQTIEKQICHLCKQFYSLNELNQCVYSKRYQIYHIKQILSDQLNKYGRNCDLYDKQCIYCSEGFVLLSNQCAKKNFKFIEYYNNQQLIFYHPHLTIFQDGIQIQKSHLYEFNMQKNFYEESIKLPIFFSQQSSKSQFIQSYYNNKQDQLSFCYSIENCINNIQINLNIIDVGNNISLQFENTIYQNLSQILDIIEQYDIKFENVTINVSQQNSSFDFHNFFKAFQIQKSNFKINLFISVEILRINKSEKILISNIKLLTLKGIIIESNLKYMTFAVLSDSLVIQNVFIDATLQLLFYNQIQIIFDNLFYYGQIKTQHQLMINFFNTQSVCQQILIKNSMFKNFHLINSTFFQIYNSKSQIQIYNCNFIRMIFEKSFFLNSFTDALQITLKKSHFDQIKFKQQSYGFFFHPETLLDAINNVIFQDLLFLNILLDDSFLINIIDGIYDQFQLMKIQFDKTVLINSSLIYIDNIFTNIIGIQNISCFNFTFVTSQYFFRIKAQKNILFKNIYIKEIQGAQNLYSFVNLEGNRVIIENYLFKNILFNFRILQHFQIIAASLTINVYDMKSLNKTIKIYQDMNLKIQSELILNNLMYTDIIFYGNTFISLIINDGKFISQDFDLYITIIDSQLISSVSQQIFSLIANNQCQMSFNYTTIILDFGQSYHKINQIISQQGQFNTYIKDAYIDVINLDQSAQLFKFTGYRIEILSSEFKYHQEIESDHQNYLFSIQAQQILIDSLIISIKDQKMNCIELIQRMENQQAVEISNIILMQDSYLRNFIILDQSNYKQLTVINMQAIRVKMEQNIFTIIPEPDFQVKLINLHYVVEFMTQSKAFIIMSQSQLQAELKNITFKLLSKCENVIKFQGVSLMLQYIEIQNILSKGIEIDAQILVLDGIYISQSNTGYQLINIQQSSIQNYFMMLNIFIQGNQVFNNLVNIQTREVRLFIIRNINFYQNKVDQNSLLLIKIQNYFNQYIFFNKFVLISNTCSTCITIESDLIRHITLQKLWSVNNQASQYYILKKIKLKIVSAIINDELEKESSTYFESDQDINILESNLIWSQGQLASYQNTLYIQNSYITLNDHQVIKQGDDKYQIPDKLQLYINQPKRLIRLLEEKIDSVILYRIDSQYYGVSMYNIYFPSGCQMKNYKILDLKSKQFNDYINYIAINGVDYQNIQIKLNKCNLNTDIKSQDKISIIPNYINSETKLSDIILIANPYVIQQFTLQVQCIYQNITLQLNIDARVFKCQIGEILQNNQCQQCNITNNQYSVNKRSQLCKYIDHNVIEDYKIGLLKLKQGYWRPYYSNDQIELCKTKENCLGGWNVDYESCQIGYFGPLCNECDFQNVKGDGFYSKYKQQCFTCQYNINVFYIIVIVIIQLITLIITTRAQYLNNQRYQQLIFTNRYYKILNKLSIDQISVVFKQIQNYFFYIQFIDLTFEVDLNLGFFGNFVSNPIQLLNPYYDCISQYYNYSIIIKILMQIVTPLFIVILFYILILMVHKFYKFKQLFVFIYVPLLYFFIIYQIIIFQNSLSQITFVTISGIKYINGSRSLQFYEQNNINQFLFSSIILITFAIFIPSALIYILKKKRTQLYNKTLLMKIGYLYQEYKNQIYFWEFYKMGFKMLFVGLNLLLINQMKVVVIFSILIILLKLEIGKLVSPFYLKNLNMDDYIFHAILILTLFLTEIYRFSLFSIKILALILLYLINFTHFINILRKIIYQLINNNIKIIDKLRVKINKNSQPLEERKELAIQRFKLLRQFYKGQYKQINTATQRSEISLRPSHVALERKKLHNLKMEYELMSLFRIIK